MRRPIVKVIEKKEMPPRCLQCAEVLKYGVDVACYNCDYALERFEIVSEDKAEKN